MPRYPGDVPAGTLPADWLQGLERRATAAAVG
jgi:hypothetical protein